LFRDNRVIRPAKNGGFELRLSAEERDLLARLPLELVELLELDPKDDPAVARLFPDAYAPTEAEFNDEYQRLMNEDLRDRHRAALESIAADAHATTLSADRLYAWMTGLGQLRLVIGTRLGVTEDTEPDDSPEFALYGYLSYLQEQVVEAMTTTL
jgi:hypothetical protein